MTPSMINIADINSYLNMNKVNPDNKIINAIKFSITSFLTIHFKMFTPS